MEELELSVVAGINNMDSLLSSGNKPGSQLNTRLRSNLMEVRQNLHKLAANLNMTLNHLDSVEKDTEVKEKQLEEVLKKQAVEENAHQLEARGADAVDYESGRLKNTSDMVNLSDDQRKHFEKVKNEADPAVGGSSPWSRILMRYPSRYCTTTLDC
ncbi:hypothetical protein DYB32_003629 [Aphanomyces invadans]|uniref:Uncharacterized protein n=1 Tax=Aphanomyces invadans TaxID=157072 RepID=A0A3R6Z632_9STRA|nr:hypothetical protein DYB32_003629 [Aphanomyces invadans]